jgi:hypothetical protein
VDADGPAQRPELHPQQRAARPLVDAEVTALVNAGFVVVAGAGEDNANACNYSPARVSDAITVSATDLTDDRTANGLVGGNFGSCVDLFAPGVDIAGAWLPGPGNINTVSGVSTAAAAAHVAGAAALLLDANPGLSPAAVRNWITNDATVGVVSDPGTGSPNLLLYVQPGTCDPCPTCGGGVSTTNQAMTASIVGPVDGTPWSWKMVANNPGDFPDTPIVFVPGVTSDHNGDGSVDEMDVAQKLADSINAYWSTVGCDSSAVTGNIWASAIWVNGVGGPVPYISISSQCAFTLYLSDASVDPLDPACPVMFPFTCQINPTVEPFPGSGTDCNRNGTDDFFDTTFGLSPDVNLNAIPDECEGLAPEQVELGLTVQALGQAIITSTTTDDGVPAIVVFNIGSSGKDGYHIDLGQAQGWEATFHGPMVAADLPTGFMFTDEVIGSVNGVPGQTIMTTRFEDVGDTFEITPEFALPGVTSYTIDVYDHGKLVTSIPDQSGPAYRIAATAPRNRGGYISLMVDDCLYKCFYNTSVSIPIQIVDGPLVTGDRVEITSQNGTGGVQWTSEIRRGGRTVGAGQVSEIVERMVLQQFGNEHAASGVLMRGVEHPAMAGALALEVSAGRGGMVTGNIVVNKGRPLDLVSEITVDTTPIQLGDAEQTLMLRARGNFGGTPDADLGETILRSTGADVEIIADFASLGSSMTSLAVYDQGVLVGEAFVPTGGVVGTISDAKGGVVTPDGVGKLSGAYPCFVVDFPVPIVVTPASSPLAGTEQLVGDELRVIALGATASVDGLDSIVIGAEGLDAYTLLDETFDVTPNCPADLDGSGDVGFTDLTALLGAWGPCGAGPCPADLDGDGQVGFTDLTTLLGAWGPCA